MSASPELTAELRAEVSALEDDLRIRLEKDEAKLAEWRALHAEAVKRERTAATWRDWADERITQAAAAWVLLTVFIRFCEDNGLVKKVWISGPEHGRQEALDAQAQFIREQARTNPDVTDRDWLKNAKAYLAGMPATSALVDEHSALDLVEPSGDAAAALLSYWRETGEDGRRLRDLTDPEADTRFLGDLYQDLSESARKRYALLQTPVFVEEFILDRTLTPALAERPLEGFRLIDPTCGSGHFLLGAFPRLLDRWHAEAPGLDERERVQHALDAVHGVDVNPFAVAITRFRLTVAALKASGIERLEDAPAFKYHLAVGDSLLHGGQRTFADDMDVHDFAYATEDSAALEAILHDGSYDVVVGNPPYITVKDKALNAEYRRRYNYCKGTYALTVPFMERFFALAKSGERAGWVGQITSNSFMKREFGAPLIEQFLPTQDLVLVADTSGAYIPGHGTPTVIIVGRHRRPATETVRAVLGIRGEPGSPEDAAKGKVWMSIVDHFDDPGWTDEWISVVDLERMRLAKHPWSLSGGGAVELLEAIDTGHARTLSDLDAENGRTTHTGADEVFYLPHAAAVTRRLLADCVPVALGDGVRDFTITTPDWTLFPYDQQGEPRSLSKQAMRCFWLNRTVLRASLDYQQTREQRGLRWFDHSMFFKNRYRRPLSVAFAFVATHNHFVLDGGGKVFKQSAPVIKLPEGVSEDDHLALLGVLNSSTACFWLKQNSHNKGEGGGARVEAGYAARGEPWRDTYEFTGTTLQDFPLPASLPLERGCRLDSLAQRLAEQLPSAVCERGTPTREALDVAHAEHDRIRTEMIAQQEELDWNVYRLYGLVDEDLTYHGGDLPGLALGERASEIVLARRMRAGEEDTTWFARHGSTPLTELPGHWPAAYRELVARRIELVESHPYLKLLERPEHKRRWAAEPWAKQEERALRHWLLDRLEDKRFWFDRQGRPVPRSVAQLADEVTRDQELTGVLALWEGRPDVSVAKSLEKLVAEEAVPYLAAHRYKEPGLRKRDEWEKTWALQRREDAGEKLAEPIPVPPKYTSADFTRKEYWANRGKLDVPKERFVLYPEAGRDTDPTPMLGWAGWDHAQQALALAQLVQRRRAEGAADERITPLVAGLAELQPWIVQWHGEPDPFYGGNSPAAYFAELLGEYAGQLATTVDDLREWRPVRRHRGRARKATTA